MDGQLRPVPGHPRDDAIEAAVKEIVVVINEWRERHQMTAIEFLYILGVMQHRTVNALALGEREFVTKQGKKT